MYRSKEEVETIFDELDVLVKKCVDGELSFERFLLEYGYPMGYYALDGHESDDVGKSILEYFATRISLHSDIADQVLHKICSVQQAEDTAYKNNKRIPPSEAFIIFCKAVASHAPSNT